MSDAHGTAAAPLRAVVEELVRAGVRDVVICPGSRSTPLALALRAAAGLRCWVHLDERAGAYFALGAAKACRRPAAILATSGTAVVNFAPAVVEAHHARVPLVLLTADRPPESRDRGAPQTIDQDHLYGRFSKWYAELPVPDGSTGLESHVRSVVSRAVSVAVSAPAGPVQLNAPFREPLIPDGPLSTSASVDEAPFTTPIEGRRRVDTAALERLSEHVSDGPRGLIVCGPLDAPGFPEAIARLAEATGYPVLADPLSNVRSGPHDRSQVVARYDAMLRAAHFREGHAPDLVLRFGATPTSKVLDAMLRVSGAAQIVVDDGGWVDAVRLPLTRIEAEPVTFAEGLAAAVGARGHGPDGAWLESWVGADAVAEDALRRWQGALSEPFAGALYSGLPDALPDGALLVVGNSMPVRDLDAFLPTSPAAIRCLGNRGANGIDGLVSTALGAAAAQDDPVVAIVGDIGFIHDLNTLVAARRLGLTATIVLINDDGGGIFSFLPQASADRPEVGLPEHYEELFGTPHCLDFRPLVTALGAEHQLLGTDEATTLPSGPTDRLGLRVLELRIERTRNAALHREALAAVSEALEARA